MNNYDVEAWHDVVNKRREVAAKSRKTESPRDPEMQIHYHPTLPSSRTTLHKIYRNKEYQSHLLLPIISGKEAAMEVMSDENFQGGV